MDDDTSAAEPAVTGNDAGPAEQPSVPDASPEHPTAAGAPTTAPRADRPSAADDVPADDVPAEPAADDVPAEPPAERPADEPRADDESDPPDKSPTPAGAAETGPADTASDGSTDEEPAAGTDQASGEASTEEPAADQDSVERVAEEAEGTDSGNDAEQSGVDQVPQEQVPQEQVPQEQVPQEQVPQEQVPQEAATPTGAEVDATEPISTANASPADPPAGDQAPVGRAPVQPPASATPVEERPVGRASVTSTSPSVESAEQVPDATDTADAGSVVRSERPADDGTPAPSPAEPTSVADEAARTSGPASPPAPDPVPVEKPPTGRASVRPLPEKPVSADNEAGRTEQIPAPQAPAARSVIDSPVEKPPTGRASVPQRPDGQPPVGPASGDEQPGRTERLPSPTSPAPTSPAPTSPAPTSPAPTSPGATPVEKRPVGRASVQQTPVGRAAVTPVPVEPAAGRAPAGRAPVEQRPAGRAAVVQQPPVQQAPVGTAVVGQAAGQARVGVPYGPMSVPGAGLYQEQVKARRRRWVLAVAAGTPVLLVLALVAVQLLRSPPPARVTILPPAVTALPGSLKLPWPSQGQATIAVPGIGQIGSYGGSKPHAIGSVAKVMTAYLVLADHPLHGKAQGPTLTVSKADVADYKSRVASEQSLVKVRAGEKITERQALEAILLPSANNVAHMLAIWDAGSVGKFVAKMNATARRLGMTGTTYTDPSGFRPDTVSTAADQVVLGAKAMAVRTFATIAAERSATLPVAGEVTNFNYLLGSYGVVGIKTGSTDQAGGNLLFAARHKVAGRSVLIVGAIFNQPGTDTNQQLAAVNDVARGLLARVEQVIRPFTLVRSGAGIGHVRTDWGASTALGAASTARVIGWPTMKVTSTVRTGYHSGTIAAGQLVGRVILHAADTTRTVRARAAAAVPGPSAGWRLTRL